MEDGAGYPSDLGPAEPMTDADQLSTPSRNGHSAKDNDNSATHHLRSFTKRALKIDFPLICQPPKQLSPAKLMLSLRSKWVAARSLSRVSASQRGEVLVMRCVSLTTGLSTPNVSGRKAYEGLDVGLNASNVKALDALSLDVEAESCR
jgi:hypothetical protein